MRVESVVIVTFIPPMLKFTERTIALVCLGAYQHKIKRKRRKIATSYMQGGDAVQTKAEELPMVTVIQAVTKTT